MRHATCAMQHAPCAMHYAPSAARLYSLRRIGGGACGCCAARMPMRCTVQTGRGDAAGDRRFARGRATLRAPGSGCRAIRCRCEVFALARPPHSNEAAAATHASRQRSHDGRCLHCGSRFSTCVFDHLQLIAPAAQRCVDRCCTKRHRRLRPRACSLARPAAIFGRDCGGGLAGIYPLVRAYGSNF